MPKRTHIDAFGDEERNDLIHEVEQAAKRAANELALRNFLNLVSVAEPNNPTHVLLIEQTIASLLNTQESVSEGDSLWDSESMLKVMAPTWDARVNKSNVPPQVQPDVPEPPQVEPSQPGNHY
ncbi:MAG: hypothetical protein WC748_00425 [Legionellales bacterium]|jgi:hypothetical protein